MAGREYDHLFKLLIIGDSGKYCFLAVVANCSVELFARGIKEEPGEFTCVQGRKQASSRTVDGYNMFKCGSRLTHGSKIAPDLLKCQYGCSIVRV